MIYFHWSNWAKQRKKQCQPIEEKTKLEACNRARFKVKGHLLGIVDR